MKVTGIIFYEGMIEALDYFTEQVRRAAKSYGLATLVLRASQDAMTENAKQVAQFAESCQCIAFLFNNIYLEFESDGENIWEKNKIPVFDMLVDHPVYFTRYFQKPLRDVCFLVIDRDHGSFIRRWFPQVKHVCFLPHGGASESGIRPYREREIDVLYTGSCQIDPDYVALEGMEDQGLAFYTYVCEALLNEPSLTTEQAQMAWVKAHAPENAPGRFLYNYREGGFRCETKARREYKLTMMKALSEAGIHVEVYGHNWENPEYRYRDNIHFRGGVSSKACNELAGNAKISLNMMPWFKDGAHERIYNAMVNGAVCVTDTSKYLLEQFEHGRNIVFYELTNIPQLVHNIKWLLDNPEHAEQIARRGYERAIREETWKNRLDTVLEMAENNIHEV